MLGCRFGLADVGTHGHREFLGVTHGALARACHAAYEKGNSGKAWNLGDVSRNEPSNQATHGCRRKRRDGNRAFSARKRAA
jgi:hypothetical protein